MSTTSSLHRNLKADKYGISNVIVMVLSLVVLVMIVSNVIFWSYEMNQWDWERMQEDVSIVSANRIRHSSWVTAIREYAVDVGSHQSGTYEDTYASNDTFETFTEALTDEFRLEIRGFFTLDTALYPIDQIQTIELRLKHRASDSEEKWHLRAFNWSSSAFEDRGFNITMGYQSTANWSDINLNLTESWQHFVHVNGSLLLKVTDEVGDFNQTSVDIDFFAIRAVIDGTEVIFRNNGPSTMHLLSLWMNNQTLHRRYDIDIFLNSAETSSYITCIAILPAEPYTVKVVTERGNIAVYSKT